jgi:hypothetical protein
MRIFWKSVLLVLLHHQGFAQIDSSRAKSIDTIKVGNITIVKSGIDSIQFVQSMKDTIRIQSGVIIVSDGLRKGVEKIRISVDSLKSTLADIDLKSIIKKKPKKYSTNWFVWDLGFSGYNDHTNFPLTPPLSKKDFALKTTRVSNFNLWFFIQRMSLIKQVVNLKYGLGIESNNYYFKTGIRYEELTYETLVSRTIGSIGKNKLVANYLTAPLMINVNTNPSSHKKGLQLSAGLSGGYLISSWQKMKVDSRGSKVKSEFNLSPWKLSYIGELGLGAVRLYGSYAPRAIHQYGVDQRPYTVGVRFSY